MRPTLWDLFCITSLVGIWPRFIEPKMLRVEELKVSIKDLHPDLQGCRIVQFSDLHLHEGVSDRYLNKIHQTIHQLKPDIILFTGDLLCHSKLKDPERLHRFLCSLKASHGCFGIFGNHDYAEYVSLNLEGAYDVASHGGHAAARAFKRFFSQKRHAFTLSERAKAVDRNSQLSSLLASTHFHFLENQTEQVKIRNATLNICGLGEYWVGRCNPKEAFSSYEPRYPGIVLTHNPDTVPRLLPFPGEIILCGHTHGAQVNLPLLWNKFTVMEYPQFKRGLVKIAVKEGEKIIYINRGLGSVEPFRWFSPPELLLLTLGKK